MAVKNKDLDYTPVECEEEESDEISIEDAYQLLGYKAYSRLQIALTVCAMMVCLAIVAGATFLTYKMGNQYFVLLYLIPVIIYVFS